MKIGLNGTCFNSRPSGAKQRFVGLYGNLFEQMSDCEFIVFEPSDTKMDSWFKTHDNVTFKQTIIPSEGRIKKFLLLKRTITKVTLISFLKAKLKG